MELYVCARAISVTEREIIFQTPGMQNSKALSIAISSTWVALRAAACIFPHSKALINKEHQRQLWQKKSRHNAPPTCRSETERTEREKEKKGEKNTLKRWKIENALVDAREVREARERKVRSSSARFRRRNFCGKSAYCLQFVACCVK